MATAALLNSPPPQLSFPRDTAVPSSGAVTMHVARPKSAKGRRRPSFSCSQGVGACPCRVPPSPPAAARQQLANSRRGLATTPALPAGRVAAGEIPALLQQVPQRSCSSLNRYRVLPSIGCGAAAVQALAERTGRLDLGERQEDTPQSRAAAGEQGRASALSQRDGPDVESSHMQPPPEKPGRKTRQESPSGLTLDVAELPQEEPELLLAVRSPSGQRFEHCFKPSDSLQAVLAVAEQKTSSRYKHCSLETMEVPRRTFSDLTRSLHQCGILHKSVLCIHLKEQCDTEP